VGGRAVVLSGSEDKTVRLWDVGVGGASAGAVVAAATPPPALDAAIAQLAAMGFSQSHAASALAATDGSVQAAAEWALAHVPVDGSDGGGAAAGPAATTGGSTSAHLVPDAAEGLAISILPHTPWEQVQPSRALLDELVHNGLIRARCADVVRIAGEIRLKAQELRYEDEAEALVEALGGDESLLAAVVAYTHDLQQPGGAKRGNLYYEMNVMLRDRGAAACAALMETWGVVVHYTLKALSRLPDVDRTCYRGFPHATDADKEALLAKYKNGRPIQWGAFTSTTTSLQAARGFARSSRTGVIFKIRVLTGKDIVSTRVARAPVRSPRVCRSSSQRRQSPSLARAHARVTACPSANGATGSALLLPHRE
jgi:hypothetical protein